MIFLRLLIVITIALTGCEPNSDRSTIISNPVSGNVSISYLKSLYKGMPLTISDDIEIEGWVVSTDQFGSWRRTLVIEDESGGIEIAVNQAELFKTYYIGDIVEVRCNNLMLDSYGGVLKLHNITNHITITGELEKAPTAKNIEIGELNAELISRYVIIEEVQFIDEEAGEQFNPDQEYVNYHLTDRAKDTLTLRVSPYFRDLPDSIPRGSGWVRGVISYFNEEYELILNKTNDLALTDERF